MGVDLIGICRAEKNLQAEQYLREFLAAGFQGEMKYLENPALRTDPQLLLPGAQSVIVIAINYYREKPPTPPDHGRIARYAWGRDYHKVLKKILKELQQFLEKNWPAHQHKICVDSAPLLEKAFAEQAGIGFYGKNTTLISPEFGSFILLGEIITTLPLTSTTPRPGTCGTCTRCLDACPTKALIAPGRMDARRCISYLTLETKAEIPAEFATATANLIAGCDICQEVCPYNLSFAKPLTLTALQAVKTAGDSEVLDVQLSPLPRHAANIVSAAGDEIPLEEILQIRTPDEYLARFAGSPLMRPKREGLIKNALNAARNALRENPGKHTPKFLPLITQIAQHDQSPELRQIALKISKSESYL